MLPRAHGWVLLPQSTFWVPGEGCNSLPAAWLLSFGAVVCQSCPLCAVSVWCLGCFSSLPGGRTVSPRWLCARAQTPWPLAWQVFAWWLCWGHGPGCARAASLLLPAMGPQPGVCFLSGSRSGGCTTSGKEIGITVLVLLVGLGAALRLVPGLPLQHAAGQAAAGGLIPPPPPSARRRCGASLELAASGVSRRSGSSPQPQPGRQPRARPYSSVGGGAGAWPGRGTALPGPGVAVGPGGSPTPRPCRQPPALPAPGRQGGGGGGGGRVSLRSSALPPPAGSGAGGLC